MAQFQFQDDPNLDHKAAMIALLRLREQLFAEVAVDRSWLFEPGFTSDIAAAKIHADGQIQSLITAINALGPADPKLDGYGLKGEPLRFKLQVVRYANDRAAPLRNYVVERVANGGAVDARNLYRRTLEGTLAAIDGPLESITKMLGIGEGVVEFKKALEVLLKL